jgi:altronate hydrolase
VSLALVISAHDNVATALEALAAGATVQVGDASITLLDDIPRGHKVALRAIASGDAVVKYGSPIGTASQAIAAGAHVHTHNVVSSRGRGDLGGRPWATPAPAGADGRDQSAPRLAEPADSGGVDAAIRERSR